MTQQSGSRSWLQSQFSPRNLLIGASALAVYGASRRSKTGTALAAAGGVLAYSAIRSQSSSAQNRTHASFQVNATPEEAYRLWRNFENLPRFMAHLKSMNVRGDGRSEWVALGPMDREVRWTAEITEDLPNQRIAWRSLPGSDVKTSGRVEFTRHPQGRGIFVTAEIQYRVPGGQLATGLASMFGKDPEFVVREDVRRFKALLETGEVPTTHGQTHGPRGVHGYTEQVLFRETTNQVQPQARPVLARTA